VAAERAFRLHDPLRALDRDDFPPALRVGELSRNACARNPQQLAMPRRDGPRIGMLEHVDHVFDGLHAALGPRDEARRDARP
jgi:hypothetical protein